MIALLVETVGMFFIHIKMFSKVYHALFENVTKDGIILQSCGSSCSAASLANALKRFDLNVSEKEIAEKTNMNYTTVRSKIQRGRKKLKDIFTDCCVIMQGGRGSILGYESRNPCNNDSDC